MADDSIKTFDDGMRALEVLVRRLELGELSIEEALADFERGIALVRDLNQRLNDSEARIEVLTRNADGDLRLQPLDSSRPRKD